jgi:ATP-dependent DNA helicase RecQ
MVSRSRALITPREGVCDEQMVEQQPEIGWRDVSVRRTRQALDGANAVADRLALLRTLAWLTGGRVDIEAERTPIDDLDWDLLDRFGLRLSEDGKVLRLAEERPPSWWPRPFHVVPRDRRGMQPGSADAVLRRLTRNVTYLSLAQKGAVRALLTQPTGSGLMASMPTGAGKSLLFQLAALHARQERSGACVVVVTPTVALALDHERSLSTMPGLEGSRALTGDQSAERSRETVNAFRRGDVPVLLLGPEMALRDDVAAYLSESAHTEASAYGLDAKLTHLFIDEAHIVESWGRSFRPDFQRLPALLARLRAADPELRLVLLSATLGPGARAVLRREWAQGGEWLEVDARVPRYEHDVAVGSFGDERDRAEAVAWAVVRVPRPTIVYTTEVEAADILYRSLRSRGYERIARFTGETGAEARREIVHRWATDELDLVIATSAFGMGVDKADVRSVIHACLPEGPARWYQEIGRAARDGGQALAGLLFTDCGGRDDVTRARGLATGGWLTRDLAERRWAAMLRGARQKGWVGGRWRMKIDLDAIREGLRPESSDYNRMWNMALLTLVQRAGAVAIQSVEPGEGEIGHAWDVEVRDEGLLGGDAAAWDRIFAVREAELASARSEFDPFLKIARRPERACLTRAAFELIEPASLAPPCGRCPHCRAEGIEPSVYLPCGGLDAAWPNGPDYLGPLPPGPLLVEPSGTDLTRRIQRLAEAGIEQFVIEDRAVEAVNEVLAASPALLGLVMSFSEWEGDAVLAPVATALVLSYGDRRETDLVRRFATWAKYRPFPALLVAEADRLIDGRRLDQFVSRLAPIPEERLVTKEPQPS